MYRSVLWVLGGLLCSIGAMSLLFAFGTPDGDMATTLSSVGWDAVADIEPTGAAPLAAICLALGIPLLVGLNATAWKHTGGY
jgi:hypothetical protein